MGNTDLGDMFFHPRIISTPAFVKSKILRETCSSEVESQTTYAKAPWCKSKIARISSNFWGHPRTRRHCRSAPSHWCRPYLRAGARCRGPGAAAGLNPGPGADGFRAERERQDPIGLASPREQRCAFPSIRRQQRGQSASEAIETHPCEEGNGMIPTRHGDPHAITGAWKCQDRPPGIRPAVSFGPAP